MRKLRLRFKDESSRENRTLCQRYGFVGFAGTQLAKFEIHNF